MFEGFHSSTNISIRPLECSYQFILCRQPLFYDITQNFSRATIFNTGLSVSV